MRNANIGKLGNRLGRLLGSFWNDREGVTAILTALGATTLMGFAGLAIDATVWHVNQRKIQGAADQAAVAAGLAADVGASMVTQAKAVAASFGLVDGSGGVTVTVNNPPSKGTYKGDVAAIEVVISQVQPQYLSRFFLSTAPTVTERAVALYGTKTTTGATSATGPSGTMCIMALDVTGKLSVDSLGLSGGAVINAPDCDVYNNSWQSDGTEVKGASSLTAKDIYLHGGYDTSGGGSITVPSPGQFVTYTPMPMPDPYIPAGDTVRPIPSYSGCDKTNYKLSPGNSDTLSPGVYCKGMDIQGNLTLKTGTYIIDGGDLTVNSTATIDGTAGVTIILTSSSGSSYGAITINGGATLNIKGSSDNSGIAFWVDGKAPVATDKFNGGSSQIINGVIYLPNHQAQYAGGSTSGTSCSQLIALTISFTGNATFAHSCASVAVLDPPAMSVLAE